MTFFRKSGKVTYLSQVRKKNIVFTKKKGLDETCTNGWEGTSGIQHYYVLTKLATRAQPNSTADSDRKRQRV